MISLRFRSQLLLLSLITLAIPVAAWWLIHGFERYLVVGQKTALAERAKTIATLLPHLPQFPDLVNTANGSRVPDLYAYRTEGIVTIDGYDADWSTLLPFKKRYATNNTVVVHSPYDEDSLSFELVSAQDSNDLYALVRVIDDRVVYREPGSISMHRNDHFQIALVDPAGNFRRYTIAPLQPGPVPAFLVAPADEGSRALSEEAGIEAVWRPLDTGYMIEMRMPLDLIDRKLAFSVTDVDDSTLRTPKVTLGTSSTLHRDDVGKVFYADPEFEQFLAMFAGNGNIRLINRSYRLIAGAGSITGPAGDAPVKNGLAELFRPLLRDINPNPRLYAEDPAAIQSQDVTAAMNGSLVTTETLLEDNVTTVLSASFPVVLADDVVGVVSLRETTNGVRERVNALIPPLVSLASAAALFLISVLFAYGAWLSFRVKRMARTISTITEARGHTANLPAFNSLNDELDDLGNVVLDITTRLQQYHHYLESLSGRLGHELRTPLAVIRSSLDNLSTQPLSPEPTVYVERAHEGVQRLARILTSMTEASRLEESLNPEELEYFNLGEVLRGCVSGYELAYPQQAFELSIEADIERLLGLPDLIAQMLDKLVSNAVGFADPATPIVIRLTREGDAVLRVMNSGPLLPDTMRSELFDGMISIRPGRDTGMHLGLGLYIAGMIAKFHGGSIKASNREDTQGVIITVTLPVMRILGKRH